jgi:hypothetical protein
LIAKNPKCIELMRKFPNLDPMTLYSIYILTQDKEHGMTEEESSPPPVANTSILEDSDNLIISPTSNLSFLN